MGLAGSHDLVVPLLPHVAQYCSPSHLAILSQLSQYAKKVAYRPEHSRQWAWGAAPKLVRLIEEGATVPALERLGLFHIATAGALSEALLHSVVHSDESLILWLLSRPWFHDAASRERLMARALKRASMHGRLDVVCHLAKCLKNAESGVISRALLAACDGGHLLVAQWLITEFRLEDLGQAIQRACQGGHIELSAWLKKRSDRKKRTFRPLAPRPTFSGSAGRLGPTPAAATHKIEQPG
jgi:hypothetical protein